MGTGRLSREFPRRIGQSLRMSHDFRLARRVPRIVNNGSAHHPATFPERIQRVRSRRTGFVQPGRIRVGKGSRTLRKGEADG